VNSGQKKDPEKKNNFELLEKGFVGEAMVASGTGKLIALDERIIR